MSRSFLGLMEDLKSLRIDAPKYDGKTDFTMWQLTVKDVLIQQGLDDALEKAKPKEMSDADWAKIQKRAASTIRLALAPDVRYNVLKESTPKEIWDKLASIYASKSLTNRLNLKMELYSLKLDEESSLHDHISCFNQLVCHLANVDEPMKDEEQALVLLSSLPESFKYFKQTLLVGRTTLTLEDVIKALRDNERMTKDAVSQSGAVLAVESAERRSRNRNDLQGRSKSRPSKRDMSTVECYYCGETGHMQMFCPSFKEDVKSFKQMKGKNKVDDADSTLVIDDGEFLMASEDTVPGSVKNKSEWVMDSAASMHICRDRAMFETLCTDESLGNIVVGNDEKMKVQGVGTVCLKLHDGTIKKALNVRYVPDASKNVLSLSVLASRGYRFVGRGRSCKVYKGRNLILQGMMHKKNIYCLDGEATTTKTEKKVKFSESVEVLGNSSRGRICWGPPRIPK